MSGFQPEGESSTLSYRSRVVKGLCWIVLEGTVCIILRNGLTLNNPNIQIWSNGNDATLVW